MSKYLLTWDWDRCFMCRYLSSSISQVWMAWNGRGLIYKWAHFMDWIDYLDRYYMADRLQFEGRFMTTSFFSRVGSTIVQRDHVIQPSANEYFMFLCASCDIYTTCSDKRRNKLPVVKMHCARNTKKVFRWNESVQHCYGRYIY